MEANREVIGTTLGHYKIVDKLGHGGMGEAYETYSQTLEQRGETAGARAYYQKFVDYWGSGDLDRENVEYAGAFLAGAQGSTRSRRANWHP